jgi:hypothetical protein
MGRGVLALILVMVWLLPATGFAQAARDGSRVIARPASRGHERPQRGPARDRTSTQSGAPAGPRDRGSSNWSRHDRTAPPVAAPGDDLFRAGPDTFAPRFDRPARPFRHRHRFGLGYGYMSGFYFPSLPMLAAEYPPAQGSDVEPPGYLRLQVRPGTARVYVDGYYVGPVDDFNGSGPGRFLEPGPHRVEIRADGFDTIMFDVRIVPNETITYRSDLAKSDDTPQAALPSPVRAAPKTLYVIPRCYAGDTPPRAEQLPAGCNPARVRTVP